MNLQFFAQELIKTNNNLPKPEASKSNLSTAFGIFYAIVGAIAILLLVIAALRYTVAAGDANKITESKRMIAYTLVGLVVVSLAAIIVEYVLKVAA